MAEKMSQELLPRLLLGGGSYRWCQECDWVFDMADEMDSQEWCSGHDCEV